MKKSQQARLDALHRMQDFTNTNNDALGNVNKSTTRGSLDQVLTGLQAAADQQKSAETQAASATAEKNILREDLRINHMQPIAAIARAALAHMPLITKLRLPSSRVTDSELVTAGNAMADAAGQYSAVFIAEQLPADFIAQLRASVQAVRDAAVQRDGFVRLVAESTQAVADWLVRAANVAKVLNSLVVKALKGKTDLLAGWRQAKHPKAKPGVPQGSTATPAPAPLPVPVSALPPIAPVPVAQAAVTTTVAAPAPTTEVPHANAA
jgi:hypothetical protein